MASTLDPYGPCPCGSGKKYKFCCYQATGNKQRYPQGVIERYGPDDKTVTKLMAFVYMHENADPIVGRWYGEDVESDEKVSSEIDAFLMKHAVKIVKSFDEVAGCPHEEGVDFPEGEDCPLCPFWAAEEELELEEDLEEPAKGLNIDLKQFAKWLDKEEARLTEVYNRMEELVADIEDWDGVRKRMCEILKAELPLPMRVICRDEFEWEEDYSDGGEEAELEHHKLKETQPSYEDEYELLDITANIKSEWMMYGEDDLAAHVRRVIDGKTFVLGLAELRAEDLKAPGAQLLDDFMVWFLGCDDR